MSGIIIFSLGCISGAVAAVIYIGFRLVNANDFLPIKPPKKL